MNFVTNFKRSRVARVAVIAAVSIALLPCLLLAKKYTMQNAPIVPGASGEVKTGKDKNGNTTFTVEVKHLAKPGSLTPPRSTYIVWAQQKGGSPESQGILKVNDKLDGKFQSSTQYQTFDIWITAENDETAKSPNGAEVLRANGITR